MKYSCYYIIHLGCLMGFIMHFYITFGTNLLTQSPVPVFVFPLFRCFEEKEYQTESKRNETFGRVIFGTEAIQETWSRRQGSFKVSTRVRGAPYPPGRTPHPRGQPGTLMAKLFYFGVFFWSIKNRQKLAR